MGFLRSIQKRSLSPVLTELEKSGNGCDIAAENIFLGVETEEQAIGPPRASSLYSACMRMHVLGTLSLKIKKEKIFLSDRVTFGIGRAVHAWIQNTPDVLGDNRYGWWSCRCCNKVRYFGPPPKSSNGSCKHCGVKAVKYKEHYLRLNSEDIALTGHPDLFIKKTHLRVLEIKTMGRDRFKELVAPLVEHEWQTIAYMWALQQQGSGIPVPVDPQVGYILYLSKEAVSGGLPVKMFPVVRNERTLGAILDKLRSYKQGLRGFPKSLPPVLGGCYNSKWSSYQAKACPCLGECRGYLKNN